MTDDGVIGGPLGELLADLPKIPADAPREPVHTRVLPIVTTEGAELVFACWRDPGGPEVLHAALRSRVEGSLVGELSRTADDLTETPSGLTGLRFVTFADVPNIDSAVKAFGFAPAGKRDDKTRSALAHLRHEADAFGETIEEEPHGVFEAKIAQTETAKRAEEELVAVTEDVWGRNPGAPFARLRRAVAAASGEVITADLRGLDTAEAALFPSEHDALRWLGPLTFQALCDLVAVAIDRDVGRRVDWAESAPEDDGVAPPPMIRIDGSIHVPLALEVLRWCVMPRRRDEVVPPLSEWVSGSFGAKP